MTTADEEQATNQRDRNRAKAYRKRLRIERERMRLGSAGPASPCRRLDPVTLQVVEVLPASTRAPVPYPPANKSTFD